MLRSPDSYPANHMRLVPPTKKRYAATSFLLTSGLILGLGALASCAHPARSASDPTNAGRSLTAAADATLALRSFHMDATLRGPSPSQTHGATVDYQAPNRVRMVQSGPPKEIIVAIGNTLYVMDQPGARYKDGASPLLFPLEQLKTAVVTGHSGNTYRLRFRMPPQTSTLNQFAPPGTTLSGVAVTDGGLVTSVTLHGTLGSVAFTEVYQLSEFNSAQAVVPPKPSNAGPPSMQPCSPGAIICFSP